MADIAIAIGCVEDHEPDVALLKHALAQSRIDIKTFLHATTLHGLGAMIDADVDVVLLDLGLPDSQGMDTVQRARKIAGSIPLIVLTGSNESGLQAISAGADDFLDKDLIGGGQLARVISYAAERHRLRVRLEQLESERELESIRQRSRPSNAQLASQLLGERSLRDVAPEIYEQSVDEFVMVVRTRLHNNAMGTADSEDKQMRALGERIALRNAGPDDVVSILTEAVDRQRLHVGPAQFGPFVREARVALIELMGFVLAFYRRHAPIGQAQRDLGHRDENSIAGRPIQLPADEVQSRRSRKAEGEYAAIPPRPDNSRPDSTRGDDPGAGNTEAGNTEAGNTGAGKTGRDSSRSVAAVPDIDDRTITTERLVTDGVRSDEGR